MTAVSYADQVACVERELAMRRRAYPRWVEAGKMTKAKADAETGAMTAVLETLQGLAKSERLL